MVKTRFLRPLNYCTIIKFHVLTLSTKFGKFYNIKLNTLIHETKTPSLSHTYEFPYPTFTFSSAKHRSVLNTFTQ